MTSQNRFPSRDIEKTGSSNDGESVFLVVGKLRRPHGIRGEMKMTVLTDFPQLLSRGQKVFVGESHQPLAIRSARWQGEDMLIAFEEYSDRDEAGVHRNQMLYMHVEDFPSLTEGEFYLHDLVGLNVISEDGQDMGTLVEILKTGANDVYILKGPHGEEILLPAIEEVVLKVDIEKGEMIVHLLPGLL